MRKGWPKGVPKSAEHRAKLAAANVGKRHSPETREKMRLAKIGKPKSVETRARMSAARIGWEYSEETRAKMSAAKLGKPGRKLSQGEIDRFVAWRTGRKHDATTRAKMSAKRLGVPCPHARREIYKGISFRSTWEVRVARALDSLGVRWQYEVRRFYFEGKRYTYLPDFYLPDEGAFWEVKGWLERGGGDVKIAAFRRCYPEYPLVVVNRVVLEALERATLTQAA